MIMLVFSEWKMKVIHMSTDQKESQLIVTHHAPPFHLFAGRFV